VLKNAMALIPEVLPMIQARENENRICGRYVIPHAQSFLGLEIRTAY